MPSNREHRVFNEVGGRRALSSEPRRAEGCDIHIHLKKPDGTGTLRALKCLLRVFDLSTRGSF